MQSKKNVFNDNFKFTFLSVMFGFLVGAFMLIISGLNPIHVYSELFFGIFSKPRFIVWSVIYATPIILTGLAFAFANKTGLFNIGLEGQYIVGSLGAALVGYFFKLPFYIHIPLTLLSGCAAGLIWGGLIGILKSLRGINEVVSAIMFNWVAFYLLNYIVSIRGFKMDSMDSSHRIQNTAEIGLSARWLEVIFPSAEAFEQYSVWSRSFFGTKANVGIFIAIATAIFINYFLFKTKYGYSLRAVGSNKDAAEYAGISVKKSILVSMSISGLLSGMAGALHVMGNSNQVSILSVPEGYGFDGIAVALIGFMSPIGVIFSGLFFGALKYGGTKLNIVNAPTEIISIVIGFIIYSIAISNGIKMLIEYFRKKRAKNG